MALGCAAHMCNHRARASGTKIAVPNQNIQLIMRAIISGSRSQKQLMGWNEWREKKTPHTHETIQNTRSTLCVCVYRAHMHVLFNITHSIRQHIVVVYNSIIHMHVFGCVCVCVCIRA